MANEGLSPALLQQLGQAGVDGGGASASLLAGANKSQIKTVDNLWARANAYSSNAGRVVAGTPYSSTIKGDASKLGGLRAQQVANDKAADRLASKIVAGIAGLRVKVSTDSAEYEGLIKAEIVKDQQVLMRAAGYV